MTYKQCSQTKQYELVATGISIPTSTNKYDYMWHMIDGHRASTIDNLAPTGDGCLLLQPLGTDSNRFVVNFKDINKYDFKEVTDIINPNILYNKPTILPNTSVEFRAVSVDNNVSMSLSCSDSSVGVSGSNGIWYLVVPKELIGKLITVTIHTTGINRIANQVSKTLFVMPAEVAQPAINTQSSCIINQPIDLNIQHDSNTTLKVFCSTGKVYLDNNTYKYIATEANVVAKIVAFAVDVTGNTSAITEVSVACFAS